MVPELEETYRIFAEQLAADLNIEYDPVKDAGSEWLLQHGTELAIGVTGTTMTALRNTLEQGWSDGEGAEKLAMRIREVMETASRYRSFMIARTETTNAANMGAIATAMRAGIKTKQWWAAMDERTCPTCAALHDKVVPIDEPFPGDIMGPSRHPNCRCCLLFEVGEANQ